MLFVTMSIQFENGVTIDRMPEGGISALTLIQALSLGIGKEGSREAATKSFAKVKGKAELAGIGRGLQGTPVLLTLQHVHAVIDSKTYNSIAADFKAQHLDDIASMLPGDQQQPPPPAFTAGLTHVTGSSSSGRFSAKAASYPDFLQFNTKLERMEGVHFNSDHREEQLGGTMLKLTLSCYFAGKAKWEERKARALLQPGDFKRSASAGHSIKCDCPASIPMRWGRAHEANPLLTLLEPGHRSSITIIKDLDAIKLRECSLVMVDVAKLPPSVTRGLSQQQLASLHPMGASPDAMLVGSDASGAEILMPVECKAPCPFQHSNGAGEATWVYVPNTSSWSTIPAHYYAQCQMTMLATGCDSATMTGPMRCWSGWWPSTTSQSRRRR